MDNQENFNNDGLNGASNSDDISHLDFDIPDDLKTEVDNFEGSIKSAAIITSIFDLSIMTAFCVVNDIHAAILPNGIYGSVAFLENPKPGLPEAAIEKLTKNTEGLDAVLVIYKMGRIETKRYNDGKFVEELIPNFVIGNFSDVAEDALLGELNLFELMNNGNTVVNSQDAISHLPKNYVPKKYQPLKPKEPDNREIKLQIFDTHKMSIESARKILTRFSKRYGDDPPTTP